jgi:hypothetical protein
MCEVVLITGLVDAASQKDFEACGGGHLHLERAILEL